MITKRRSVLTISTREDFFSKFEALEYISSIAEIENVWEKNKTPILIDSMNKCWQISGYNVLEIPKDLAKVEKICEFTSWCHKNGFECGEYCTGEIYDTKADRCFLCEIANHRGFANLLSYNMHVDKSVDCIIYESPNFYVVPELGALKQGYLMIVPKQHYLSVAQFPDGDYMLEYQEVCEDVERILRKSFNINGTVTFMEHGSGPSGKTSHKKSIVHAHTHVVIDFKLKQKYKDMVKLMPCNDITQAKEVHYFSYQEGSKGQLMLSKDPCVYIQRQFPRQVMAEELGFAPEQYNWRKNEFKEVTDATLFHIHKALKEIEDEKILKRSEGFIKGFAKRN